MVTAIVIPIILFYFYRKTMNEIKRHDKEWEAMETFSEEASVTGVVLDASSYKERYYLYRYNHVLSFRIRCGQNIIVVKKTIPIKNGINLPTVQKGEKLLLFGRWEERYFQVNRIVKI
ncbi:hypothetical protein [Bacillus massilinigeriensis]|uniref:hypothetical protein n=1 Tax=Bacillus mediterraneensis TaxID=1805474 RepID=UPI0008F94117|nr:hypothetical protein [Bacillus mediterraneensis]